MLKDKLAQVGKFVSANKEQIIKKGLVIGGLVLGVVLTAILNGREEENNQMIEGEVVETDLSDQPVQ